jgi:hypothetical protein
MIPDHHRFNHPENLFHEFRQTRHFEGGRFFLNSPTAAPPEKVHLPHTITTTTLAI